jgi:signal transduction histidine kinase/ActR/RegA family two-component response regulator
MLYRFTKNSRNHSNGTFIVAMDGTVIGASDKNADCQPFIRVLLHKSKADNTAADAVAANLAANQSGYLGLPVNGKTQYYYYEPLTDVKCCQWVMVTTVNQASFAEHTRILKTGMILLCAIAVCITTVLICSVIRRQRLVVLQREEAQALSKALDDAKRANRAKSDFLSRMSHDIRTPLNGIIGMTYLAQKVENPPQTENYLEKIETSSKFLLGLINDVLDMAKAESGKIELHPEPYDIHQFIAYVEAVIKPLCAEKGIHLVFDLEQIEKRKPVMDPLRYNQLCFNLLSNAVKYTPEGGTVTLRIHDKMVSDTRLAMELIISDTGIGMSEEFQKSMFEPFTQENRNDISLTRGSGLGLAIAKKIIDLMGGTVEVHSKPGEGTAYYIQFAFDSVAAGPVAQAAPEDHTADYDSLAGKHVLLCEDHPLNQEITKALLNKKGMIVVTAENGLVGIEKFRRSVPGYYSAILMDIRMPVMDGYAATRKIRALERADAQSVPIIAMTADAFIDDIQRCLDAGMNAHLSKPIDPAQLYQQLLKSC